MNVLPAHPQIVSYLKKFRLTAKYQKQIRLLEQNIKHPSLRVERLEPKAKGIYSFRLDLKYRGLFIFRDDLNAIEVLAITKHYR